MSGPLWSDGEIRDRLARWTPELAEGSVALLKRSPEKTVWSLGPDHVLRRATTPDAAVAMTRERALLDRLLGRTSLAIPVCVFAAPDAAFDVLRKAPGEPRRGDAWASLDREWRRGFATALGRFVAELHDLVPIATARGLGFERQLRPPSRRWARRMLSPHVATRERRRLLDDVLRVVPRLHEDVVPAVLLHDDLSRHNVGFSAAGDRVLGVFDFTRAEIGDPHRDLRYAYGFEPFADAMVDAYERTRGVTLDRARIRAWHAWSAVKSVAFGIEQGEGDALAARWHWFDRVARWRHADFV